MADNPLRRLAHGIVSAFTSIKDAYVEEKIVEAKSRKTVLEGLIDNLNEPGNYTVGVSYESLMPRSAGDSEIEKEYRKIYPRPMLTKVRLVHLDKSKALQAAEAELEEVEARIAKYERRKSGAVTPTESRKSSAIEPSRRGSESSASIAKATSGKKKSHEASPTTVVRVSTSRRSSNQEKILSKSASGSKRSQHGDKAPRSTPSGSQQRPPEGSRRSTTEHPIRSTKQPALSREPSQQVSAHPNPQKSRSPSSDKLSRTAAESASKRTGSLSGKRSESSSEQRVASTRQTVSKETSAGTKSLSVPKSAQYLAEKSRRSSEESRSRSAGQPGMTSESTSERRQAAREEKAAKERKQSSEHTDARRKHAASSSRSAQVTQPRHEKQPATEQQLVDNFFLLSTTLPASTPSHSQSIAPAAEKDLHSSKTNEHEGSRASMEEHPLVDRELIDLFSASSSQNESSIVTPDEIENTRTQVLQELNVGLERTQQEDTKKLASTENREKYLSLRNDIIPYRVGPIMPNFSSGDTVKIDEIKSFASTGERTDAGGQLDILADMCSRLVCAYANCALESLTESYAKLYELKTVQGVRFNDSVIERELYEGKKAMRSAMEAMETDIGKVAKEDKLMLPPIPKLADRLEEIFHHRVDFLFDGRPATRSKFFDLMPAPHITLSESETRNRLVQHLTDDREWIQKKGEEVFKQTLQNLRQSEQSWT